MKRREDRAVREVMKRLLRSNLRFHKTDCGRFGAMTAWGLKDTSSRPAKDLGGTLRHTYITNLLYAGVDPKTVQYVTVNEVNSNIIFEGKSWIAAMNEPCLPKRIYGYCMAAADFHILTCLRGRTCPFRRKFHYGKKI